MSWTESETKNKMVITYTIRGKDTEEAFEKSKFYKEVVAGKVLINKQIRNYFSYVGINIPAQSKLNVFEDGTLPQLRLLTEDFIEHVNSQPQSDLKQFPNENPSDLESEIKESTIPCED